MSSNQDDARSRPAAANGLPRTTQVLIAGGGPVGLAAAIELGRRGIDCVVVEPRRTVSRARPRCKTVNVRTMEHLRRWGIADRLRERAPLPVSWSSDIVFCTSLAGRELSRFTGVLGLVIDDRSPEPGQQCPQYVLEELLRDVVDELDPCTLVTGHWDLDPVAFATDLKGYGVPSELADATAGRMDAALKDSILRLYRSAVHVGAEWEEDLGGATSPALVLWGIDDQHALLNSARNSRAPWAARCSSCIAGIGPSSRSPTRSRRRSSSTGIPPAASAGRRSRRWPSPSSSGPPRIAPSRASTSRRTPPRRHRRTSP